MHDQVSCPKCGNEFAVGEALEGQVRAQMRGEMQAELQRALDDAKRRSDEELSARIATADRDLAEARKRATDLATKETDLLRKQRDLEERTANAAVEFEQRLVAEQARATAKAEQAARVRFEAQTAKAEEAARLRLELQAAEAEQARAQMASELVAARKRADEAGAKEADVLRMRRELEEREVNATLALEQKLAAERAKVMEQAEHAARTRFEILSKVEAERLARENAMEVERLIHDSEVARARMQIELAAAKKRADDVVAKEAELLRKQRDLEVRETNAELDLEQKLATERAKVKAEAERVVEERMQRHSQQVLDDLRRESDARVERIEKDLIEARKRAESGAQKEVELLRKEQELDDARRALALDTEKRLLEERQRIQKQSDAEAAQRIGLIQDQTRLREKEHEEKTAQLQRTVDQLQQRLTQGAQQAQGEAQELVLKDILVEAFAEDCIEDVAKGVSGADLVQRVQTSTDGECGIILWESKRTQGWSAAWLEKLRDDQREIGAFCAVIVTQALPPGIVKFGVVDGIWVCGWNYASALGAVLRAGMKDVHRARRSADGRDTKMHLLYDYLVGHEFRHRVQGVIESIVSMQEELGNEQRAYTRLWRKRAKTMNRALTQISSVYGDLQGIVGAKLEDITPLALPSVTRRLAAPEPEDELEDDVEADDLDDVGASVSPELESAMLALIPADGSAIGNGTLSQALARHLACSEADFHAAKSALLAKGYVKKGKGRGGSVSRIVTEGAL